MESNKPNETSNYNEEQDPAGEEPGGQENQQAAAAIGMVKEFGQTAAPAVEPEIYCMTIIGQIEGHIVMPPHNKTTKYEHIIPSWSRLSRARRSRVCLLF